MSQASKLIPVNIFESISGERVAELTDLRLPSNINSCIRLQPKGFASDSYFVEDNVIFKDEKGIQQTKTCPVTSFIRWRYAENKDQSQDEQLEAIGVTVDPSKKVSVLIFKLVKMESNTRLIEWSDGSKSFAIGNQLYDV